MALLECELNLRCCRGDLFERNRMFDPDEESFSENSQDVIKLQAVSIPIPQIAICCRRRRLAKVPEFSLVPFSYMVVVVTLAVVDESQENLQIIKLNPSL